MKRQTLKECIDLFGSWEHQEQAIRNMEWLGEWSTAAIYWTKIGEHREAELCNMIVSATEKGNKYRESVKHLTTWMDNAVENGMDANEALRMVYPEMNEIHNSIYKNVTTT